MWSERYKQKQKMQGKDPRPQALFGKRRYDGKIGGARYDGSEALWQVHQSHNALRIAQYQSHNPKRITLDQGVTPRDEAARKG